MSTPFPSISVVIAARPGQAEVRAVEAARRLECPSGTLEILVARGRQPSVQRNQAARETRGEWLYFLDDDSTPPPDVLLRCRSHFQDPRVAVIGGPNLCPPEAPSLEHAFAGAMADSLAFGPSAARYRAEGAVRDSSEKELILCNLLMRRDRFLEAGGFDEALYPNEENALMDGLLRGGWRLVYDPDFWVYRRPRATRRAFARMVFTYGRGRAEQVRLHPSWGSLPNLVPSLFVAYLVLLPWLPRWAFLGLSLYALAVLISCLRRPRLHPKEFDAAPSKRLSPPFWRVAPWVVATHLGYGLGFLRGLFTTLKPASARPKIEVVLERIHPTPSA